MPRSSKFLLVIAAQLVALSLSGWAQAPCGVPNEIYCQTWKGNVWSASQNDTTPGGQGNFATVYDNFTLPQGNGQSWNLQSIHWIGEYGDIVGSATITAWNVGIYADNAGQPGNLLTGLSIPGTGNETFFTNNGSDPAYLYWVYPSGVTLSPNTKYWLALYPDLALPRQWGWDNGNGTDGGYQDFFGIRYGSPDSNFALDGVQNPAPAPEPGTLIMLSTGFLALAGRVRRNFM
jgi:hypothetical protein